MQQQCVIFIFCEGRIVPLTVKSLPNTTEVVDKDRSMAVGVDGGASASEAVTAKVSHRIIQINANISIFEVFIFHPRFLERPLNFYIPNGTLRKTQYLRKSDC